MSSNVNPGGKYVKLSYQCEICYGVSLTNILYCEQCMQHMCTSCGSLHDNFRLLANHKITKLTAANTSNANKALPDKRNTDTESESKLYDYADNEALAKLNVQLSSQNPTDYKAQTGYVNVPEADGYIRPTAGKARQTGIMGKRPVDMTNAAAKRPVDKTNAAGKRPVDTANAAGKRPVDKKEAIVEDDDKLHDYDQVDEMTMEPIFTITGDRFDVTVQDTLVANKSGIVGHRVLVINEAGITVLHKVTKSPIMVFPLPWLRRFGQRDGIFYFEVGRKCRYGDGVVNVSSADNTPAKDILKSLTIHSASAKITLPNEYGKLCC
ncbi:uncharacterized protein LOC127874922 [Dreissena polymorpha]|uniref:B box-type domain-containing protein n=1 Tax=Dreissena polymorpha TaxID=45954 RepID=A0A9D4L867_DREPO|nr:uncharacterized protein LOC127874922 [Dreissena polymorpha]KAH3852251.1 hypothetical protein DPMN_094753 [Dreissena polymorpha]